MSIQMGGLARGLVAACALVFIAGCASTGGSGSSGGSRTSLTAEDLRTETAQTLEDAIRQLRPQWLQTRGVTSMNNQGDIVVYQDGNRMGGREVLRGIPVTVVESVRFLSAGEATTRYGTGHAHGAIVVTTRRR